VKLMQRITRTGSANPGRAERAPVVAVLDERLDLTFEVAG
jgi:hypothetical protein